jgi:pimeloyl-ACP methyl ester carboxylesterase
MKAGRFGLGAEPRVEVPTGCAIFPREITRPPRSWAETRYNVTHWTEMPSGGHFAALEEPDLLVDDVRAFFSSLR